MARFFLKYKRYPEADAVATRAATAQPKHVPWWTYRVKARLRLLTGRVDPAVALLVLGMYQPVTGALHSHEYHGLL